MVARAGGEGEPPAGVTPEEVDRACRHLEGKPRVRALVRFLWVTGARVSEALGAVVADLDFRQKTVRLVTLKRGGKDKTKKATRRVLPVPGDVLGDVAMLINLHKLESGARVFPWSRQRAFELVRDAFMAIGTDRSLCHPHAIRHGHALHALRNGTPLNIIQRVLGHASIVTTSQYLRATGQDVAREYGRFTW
jgi:integrase/recombinase XerD